MAWITRGQGAGQLFCPKSNGLCWRRTGGGAGAGEGGWGGDNSGVEEKACATGSARSPANARPMRLAMRAGWARECDFTRDTLPSVISPRAGGRSWSAGLRDFRRSFCSWVFLQGATVFSWQNRCGSRAQKMNSTDRRRPTPDHDRVPGGSRALLSALGTRRAARIDSIPRTTDDCGSGLACIGCD